MTGPVVAIVGRPNVGKSALFNRLVGRRVAIVEDLPGTTRDRLYGDVSWSDNSFTVVDTGGLESHPSSDLVQQVKAQVEEAVQEATVIIFVVDGREGLVSTDLDIADMLRRCGKPAVLAVNKVDYLNQGPASDVYQLAFSDPILISAYHGRGIDRLLDRVISLLPPASPAPALPEMMKVAIVGRPNVGKSLLLNSLLGQERAIVSEIPGTTRDATDTVLEYDGQHCLLIDTAGIRRPGRVELGVEKYSVLRAKQAIERADIALVLVDAAEGITAQDSHIAGYVHQAFKGLVIVVNKWDLVESKDQSAYIAAIRGRMRFLSYASILFISAKEGTGVDRVLSEARRVYEERLKRIPTAGLNEAMETALKSRNPPSIGGKRLRIYYVTQAEVNPPTFVFFVNDPKLLHFSYQRYMENRLREVFGFAGTAVRFIFKPRVREARK
ncbi:MAG: ribosome biogenesis GTPase Der [Chloroflexi bacterium]|nr:ribosome biogenesis GTPase Der [Chloroflexota bacterium]